MKAFEKPDLHASAVQIVRMNNFAAITALCKEAGFGQPDSCLAPNLCILVSASNIFGSAGIFFERQLLYLYAFPVVRFAYDFVMGASISQDQVGFQFGELGISRLLHRLGADCLPNLFGGDRSMFLCGASRQAPDF
jgi:hypothetical protein